MEQTLSLNPEQPSATVRLNSDDYIPCPCGCGALVSTAPLSVPPPDISTFLSSLRISPPPLRRFRLLSSSRRSLRPEPQHPLLTPPPIRPPRPRCVMCGTVRPGTCTVCNACICSGCMKIHKEKCVCHNTKVDVSSIN